MILRSCARQLEFCAQQLEVVHEPRCGRTAVCTNGRVIIMGNQVGIWMGGWARGAGNIKKVY